MEETKLQALVDSLSGHGGRKGLGTNQEYSWSKTNNRNESGTEQKNSSLEKQQQGRDDGLPDNALYAPFLREGAYDPTAKSHHGDGRTIKRDFSNKNHDHDAVAAITESSSSSDNNNLTKEERKAAKKAIKLEAKRQAKLEVKRKAKRAEKEVARKRKKKTEEKLPSSTTAKEQQQQQNKDGEPKKKKKNESVKTITV